MATGIHLDVGTALSAQLEVSVYLTFDFSVVFYMESIMKTLITHGIAIFAVLGT